MPVNKECDVRVTYRLTERCSLDRRFQATTKGIVACGLSPLSVVANVVLSTALIDFVWNRSDVPKFVGEEVNGSNWQQFRRNHPDESSWPDEKIARNLLFFVGNSQHVARTSLLNTDLFPLQALVFDFE